MSIVRTQGFFFFWTKHNKLLISLINKGESYKADKAAQESEKEQERKEKRKTQYWLF